MRITLKQKEIELALALYIGKNGINLDGKTVGIAFTAGRGAAGLTAEVDIEDVTPVSNVTLVAPQAASPAIAQAAPVSSVHVVEAVEAAPVAEAATEASNDDAPAEAAVPAISAGSIFG